jgi:hypothetical protein
MIQVVLPVDKFGPPHQVAANFGMAIQKPIEASEFAAPSGAGSKVGAIHLEVAFALHETDRLIVESLRRGGVVFEPLPDLFVIVKEIAVIDALGFFPELFGNPGVIVQEHVEAAKLGGGIGIVPVSALGAGVAGEA